MRGLTHRAVRTAALSFVLFVVLPKTGWPCSTAGCPLVTQNPDGSKSKGSWSFDLSFRGMTQDQLTGSRGDEPVATSALIDFENKRLLPGHHQDAVMKHRLFETNVSYGLTDRITLFAALPIMNVRRHDQRDLVQNVGIPHTLHEVPAGSLSSIALANVPTGHEQKGIGDLQVGAGILLSGGSKRSVFMRVSVKAPTGSITKADVYGFIDRPDLQPGSGSWDGVVSLQAQQRWRESNWSIFGGAYGRLNGESERTYKFGNEASFAVGLTSGVARRVRPSLQVGYRITAADRFISKTVPSTGMRAWTLTPGARVRMGGQGSLYVYAKLPIATSVNGTQLAPRIDILAGVSRSF